MTAQREAAGVKIRGIDHIVLTVSDAEASRRFYEGALGMACVERDGRMAFRFGAQELKVHRRPAEFLPAARCPAAGSLDLCFAVEGDLAAVLARLRQKGVPVEAGPVPRSGARGGMQSVYVRDPDGNLVELCSYDAQRG